MSLGLLFHNDLDGLFSAKMLIHSKEFEFDKFFPIDYGREYSKILKSCDEFVIVDFGENIAGDKTKLWIDHHIRNNSYKKSYIKEARSCVQLLYDMGINNVPIDDETLEAINKVDSADYSGIEFQEVLLPERDSVMSCALALNQILMKNRKTNLSLRLLLEDTFDIESLFDKTNYMPDIINFKQYAMAKGELAGKVFYNIENYSDVIGNVPVVRTSSLKENDWQGYDRNIFNAFYYKYPYLILTFQMGNQFKFSVYNNPFYTEKETLKVYDILSNDFDELNGHTGILSFAFDDQSEALEVIDHIISLLN